MKIYTRGGDRGETGLLGGTRVSKTDPRVDAYGAVDELNAAIGLAIALDEPGAIDRARIGGVQEDLFVIGARLAAADPDGATRKGTIPTLDTSRIEGLERWIDELEAALPTLDAFVLPGGVPSAAQLHVARTVCRRAERAIVRLLPSQDDLGEVIVPYVNRLSDFLFVLARHVSRAGGRSDVTWTPQRRRGAQ